MLNDAEVIFGTSGYFQSENEEKERFFTHQLKVDGIITPPLLYRKPLQMMLDYGWVNIGNQPSTDCGKVCRRIHTAAV